MHSTRSNDTTPIKNVKIKITDLCIVDNWDNFYPEIFSSPYHLELNENSNLKLRHNCNYSLEIFDDNTNDFCYSTYFQIPDCVEYSCCSPETPFKNVHIEPEKQKPNWYVITWDKMHQTKGELISYKYRVKDHTKGHTNDIIPRHTKNHIEMELIRNKTYTIGMKYKPMETCIYFSEIDYKLEDELESQAVVTKVAVIIGLLLLCFLVIIYNVRNRILTYTKSCISFNNNQFEDPSPEKIKLNAKLLPNPLYLPLEIEMPHEIDRRLLHIDGQVGSGQFGKVFKGTFSPIKEKETFTVAIKQIKDEVTNELLNDFLKEIELMKKIKDEGGQENIVKFYGCCTKTEPNLIVLEFISGGTLKAYLEKLRREWELRRKGQVFFRPDMEVSNVLNFSNGTPELHSPGDASLCPLLTPNRREDVTSSEASPTTVVSYILHTPDPVKPDLNERELHDFALQIARGMEYLEKIGVVHRDLAARNILMTVDRTLKICDFGLSRVGVYVSAKVKFLPMRWMSIESIKSNVYSHKSDVWSYGVVLWEIGTLGAFPYQEIPDVSFIQSLEDGVRLKRPEICSDDVFKLMSECWAVNPDDRPTFNQICHSLCTDKNIYNLNRVTSEYTFPPITGSNVTLD
ncbi:proto-oncogene tyrosine-protein kinase receptor Ret isoform X2 [Aethina tumida]|uniref:proto-oncogene tyrosine-protein kinase receptor Ret isoform X2 n=1 Tax=Aethina tumida TaxID=116153 RepID=UPI002147F527|nr:proto-oncogene tyrosine-protein kinase receptor Ret isoform X2 [Aethina tumida]